MFFTIYVTIEQHLSTSPRMFHPFIRKPMVPLSRASSSGLLSPTLLEIY